MQPGKFWGWQLHQVCVCVCHAPLNETLGLPVGYLISHASTEVGFGDDSWVLQLTHAHWKEILGLVILSSVQPWEILMLVA